MPPNPSPDPVSYLPRLVRDWANTPHETHRRIEGSLLFVDLTGFTAMTERLAGLGRRGAEEVSAIISETFSAMLTEAYRAGGSLLKFGGDALLLLFQDEGHVGDAAWGAWGMRSTLRAGGRFETPAGQIRLGMTSAIASGPIDTFLVGNEDQKELFIAGKTVTHLMTLERLATTGQTLLSATTAAALPPSIVQQEGDLFRLIRKPPAVRPRNIEATPPTAPIASFIPPAVRYRHRRRETSLEHRHVAVGFVGIENLDTVIARDPEQAAAALGKLLSVSSTSAAEHGAWLLASDVAADGAKLIFTAGAPVATGHDEAALLGTLCSLLHLDLPFELRIGANHGPVFFGDIGPHYRRTLTVMGDTVNTAARLMSEAPKGAVLAASSMLRSRRAAFATGPERQIRLRGKRETVAATEISGRSGSVRSRTSILFGRERELSLFVELLEALEPGNGHFVEVVGPPGSGRSSFVDMAIDRASLPVVRVEVGLGEMSSSYALTRKLFTAISGIDLDASDAAYRLEEWATRALEPVADLSFAARALGITGIEEAAFEHVDPRFVPALTTRSLVSLLTASGEGAHIVAIDDADLADASSVAVLRQLAARTRRLGWMLCVTRSSPSDWEETAARVVELGPLDRKSAAALANRLTEDEPLSNRDLSQVLTLAGGSPLAIAEILAARRQGVALDSIPGAVEGLAAMRIDRLAPERRQQLELAAVLGTHFDPAIYEEVFGHPARLVINDDLLASDEGGRLRFANPVLREVIYNRLPFSRRIALHQSVATALDRRGAPAEERAEHLFRGEMWEEAHRALSEAARLAEERLAPAEAIHWYEEDLDCAARLSLAADEKARLWRKLGELREVVGQYAAARNAFRQAERLTKDPEQRALIMLQRARTLEQLGAYRTALSTLTRAKRLAPKSPEVIAGATARYAGIRFLQGRISEAERMARQVIEMTRDGSAPTYRALASMIVDMVAAATGRPTDGSLSQEALEIFRRQGDLARQARVTNNLGLFSFYRGEWDEAVRLYEESRATFERIGDEVNASYGANNVAEIWALQGRHQQAEEMFHEVRRVWRAAGDVYGSAYIEGQLGLLAAHIGRRAEAEDRLNGSIAEFENIGARAEMEEAAAHLLEVQLLAGDVTAARALAERLGGADAPAPRTRRLLATLAWQARDDNWTDEVEAALDNAVQVGANLDELRLLELCARSGIGEENAARRASLVSRLGIVASPAYAVPGQDPAHLGPRSPRSVDDFHRRVERGQSPLGSSP